MSTASAQPQQVFAVRGRTTNVHDLTPTVLVGEPMAELIRRDCAGWTSQSWICHAHLHRYTARLVEQMLAGEPGEIAASIRTC